METVSCPTIVFCLDGAAAAVGGSLAALQPCQSPSSLLSLWEIGASAGIHASQIARVGASGSEPPSEPATLADAVDRAIATAFSIRNFSTPVFARGAVSLRLMLLGAAWEVVPGTVLAIAEAFRALGRRYAGRRCWAEACFLLPDLMPNAPADADERCRELLHSIEQFEAADAMPVAEPGFACCWWLGRLNTLGLTLSPLTDSRREIATAIAGLLAASPDHLPATGALDGRPTHASAGYGEIFIDRAAVVSDLTASRAVHLIRRLHLDRRDRVDERRVLARVWAFAASPDCEGALHDIALTPGGERIWPGFHHDVPAEVFSGDVQGFRDSLRQAYRRFSETALREMQGKVKSSALSNGDRLLSKVEAEVREIADRSPGGLFEALAFIERMEALLFDPAADPEDDTATNLQAIRRCFDSAFADRVRVEQEGPTSDSSPKVKALRRKLAELVRLQNIAAPPALDAAVFDSLLCSVDEKPLMPIPQAIRTLTQELRERSAGWAQEKLDEEAKLGRSRERIEDADRRLESVIGRADGDLGQSAVECRRVMDDLRELQASPLNRLIGWFWRTAALKARNRRLKELQGEILPRQARALVMAYADRMQLSVDRVVYEARDSVCQAALSRLRELHERMSAGVGVLNSMMDTLERRNTAVAGSALRRCMLNQSDLRLLYERVVAGLAQGHDAPLPSAWEICFEPGEVIERRFRDAAGEPFQKILGWRMEDFATILRLSESRLQECAQWLVSAGKPLFPPSGERGLEYALLRSGDASELDRIVRHLLPDAAALGDSCNCELSAVQVQLISDPRCALRPRR